MKLALFAVMVGVCAYPALAAPDDGGLLSEVRALRAAVAAMKADLLSIKTELSTARLRLDSVASDAAKMVPHVSVMREDLANVRNYVSTKSAIQISGAVCEGGCTTKDLNRQNFANDAAEKFCRGVGYERGFGTDNSTVVCYDKRGPSVAFPN